MSNGFSILCWDGYDHSSLIDPYFKRTNTSVNARNLISDHAAAQEVLTGKSRIDILNINNPYPRQILYPANLVMPLDADRLVDNHSHSLGWTNDLEQWAYADSGSRIGICQRFGSFNLVINNRKLANSTAEEIGFRLPEETCRDLNYGILRFPEFNIFHICIGAGINPFKPLNADEFDKFQEIAHLWFENATMATDDSALLNQALISGKIDYFLSGGIFVSGAARLEGHSQIQCITPSCGPINGKGAISFMEITSLITESEYINAGYEYLNYLLEPDIALAVATNPLVCNPVVQMGDPFVFAKMSSKFLDAIQWETLEQDIARCAHYEIPPDFHALSELLSLAQSNSSSV